MKCILRLKNSYYFSHVLNFSYLKLHDFDSLLLTIVHLRIFHKNQIRTLHKKSFDGLSIDNSL